MPPGEARAGLQAVTAALLGFIVIVARYGDPAGTCSAHILKSKIFVTRQIV